MEYYTIKKEYQKVEGADMLDELTKNVVQSLTPDLRACMLAGCPLDLIMEEGTLILRTHWPVSILKDEKGRIIDIYQKKT